MSLDSGNYLERHLDFILDTDQSEVYSGCHSGYLIMYPQKLAEILIEISG